MADRQNELELLHALALFIRRHDELPDRDALTLYHAMGIIAAIVCPPTVGLV